MWSSFLPVYQSLRSNLERKTLGDIKSFTAEFCYREPGADQSLEQGENLGNEEWGKSGRLVQRNGNLLTLTLAL